MRHTLQMWFIALLLTGGIIFMSPAYAESLREQITFREAVQKALAANPEIIAFKREIHKAKARQHQSGLFPNPELAFELEGFGGNGPFSGTENAERTFSLKQEILLGGKIKKRRQIASGELENIEWRLKSLEQDIRKGVAHAFINLLGAQKALALQQDLVRLSKQVYETVKQKVDAGKVSAVEAIKADIEVKNNRQAMQSLERRMERSRKSLASFWGCTAPDFSAVVGRLENLPELPDFEHLAVMLRENPDIRRLDTETEYQRARLDLAMSQRIPDLTLSGSYRDVPETDDYAFVFEIAVPLKIFDRNQGNIEAARQSLKQVDHHQAAILNAQQRKLNAAFQDALARRDEIDALKQEIIPATRRVFSAKQEGYQSGKYTYLELLDAQRTLFESQKRYNDAMADYHLAVADIERLIGQSLDQADSHEPTMKNKGLQQEAQHNG